MVPNCFKCIHRDSSKSCPHMADCVKGSKEYFEEKTAPKTRKEVIQSASDENLAQLFCSMVPPKIASQTPNLKEIFISWLNAPADDEVLECWFLK